MSGRTKRKPGRAVHRPRFLNAIERAIVKATKLSVEDVGRQASTIRVALESLQCPAGHERDSEGDKRAAQCWRDLADCVNLAIALSELGIGAGEEAQRVIEAANLALRDVFERRRDAGAWSMTEREVDALEWLVALHCDAQLPAASYGEFERAFQAAHNRVFQAAQGNAGPGTTVVRGLVGLTSRAEP